MLRVRVLGELELELDGERLESPASRRARSLLGLLALDRRAHPRSELAARFWPDVLDESARTSLRSALTAVRRSLGPAADRCLVADRDRAGLTGEVWTDAGEFDALASAGRFEEAMDLWRGDLLAGLDDEWVVVARDDWRDRATTALRELATGAEAAGDLGASIGFARRMVALDPLGEESQRALIRLMAASGNRAGALQAYERYADRLRAELRIAPSPATRALADELRAAEPEPRPQPAVAPLPETGAVALLFTDLVGSTEMLDALGDEEAETVRRVHFGLLRDAALSHAGREVKNLGDGLMVAFRSSVEAAGCAVGIQRAVDRYNRGPGAHRLAIRVGLHVGEPVRSDDDYFGTSVVVAKRLCDRARGGQILVSELVSELVGTRGDFAFRAVGPVALKGFARPVAACELAWQQPAGRPAPLPAELTRERGVLVGREGELEVLREAWHDARAGRLRVVLVSGDAGIGKTRLVAELCRRAHAEGAGVLLGRCTEEPLAPYQPFIEALRHHLAAAPPEGVRRDLLARLVPELAEGTAPADIPRDGEGERYALFDAVASLLREAARDRPMVLVLDDLHWADAPSLLLARHLARSAGDAPLLILGTYRDDELGEPLKAALAELRRHRTLTPVPLRGLSREQVGDLVRGHGAPLAPEQVRAVTEHTEGNPLFVEEVVRQLESGSELGVPETVEDLLGRRVRRLADPVRDALAAAAVLGATFELDALERMTRLDRDALLDAMDAALAEHVLVEVPGALGRYAFAHVLIRETVYQQLSAGRRARLHAKAGEALCDLYAGALDERAAELAHHFLRAGDDARSFELGLRAARAATRVHASEAAIGHYGAALDAAVRLGLSPRDDPRLRALLIERGWQRHATGDFESAIADFGRALEAARAAGDRRLEAEALNQIGFAEKLFDVERSREHQLAALAVAEDLGDLPLQVHALNRLSLVLSNQLDLSGAVDAGERALALAREGAGDAERALAIDALKLAALQLGDLDRLEVLTAELEELERSRGDLWYLQWTLLEGAFVPLGRGRWDAAAARLEDALAISRRIGDSIARPLIHDAACWLERGRGRYERALAEGRRAAELAAPGGGGPWSGWTRATLGWCLLEVRAVDEATVVLEQGLAQAEHIADRYRTAAHLAWARTLAADADGAARAAGEADQALARLAVPEGGAYLFGFGATVALARARGGDARGTLEPLVRVARAAGWHEAVAAASLALGRSAEALELARRHGLPGIEWEALADLGRRDESAAVVGRLAARIGDEALAAQLVRAAQG